ncbi:hypothetical protein CPAV1605_882 [seawater metagenome]|uniref:Uncharacterized protein n=1 Tax=seawater metagenome TaxID=1561972 RepID=A0A5E8CJA6_9ZZZZ
MKEELKKKYNSLENKEEFILNHPKEEYLKFLKSEFGYTINKTNDLEYTVELKEKVSSQEKNIRAKHKEKLQMLKNKRCNTYGRTLKSMKKDVGEDMLNSYLSAQNSMKGYPIPDPQEILKNKAKYQKQFEEYGQMIKTMQKENPDVSKTLNNTPYHKYVEQILKKINSE